MKKTENKYFNKWHLKTEFTFADWERTQRIDSLFKKLSYDNPGKISAFDIKKEELSQLLLDVLLDDKNKQPKPEEIESLSLNEVLKIFTDFFLVYLKLQISSGNILTSFELKIKELMTKSDRSNQD